MHELFRKFARKSAELLGSAETFLVALGILIVWLAVGPRYHYSDTWQLLINTATTIVTFLMVFIIQNTQNRDAKAIQLKVDELIRGVQGARTRLVPLEELTDEELQELETDFQRIRGRMTRSGRQEPIGSAPDPAADEPA